MSPEIRILILEDEPADAELEEIELRRAGIAFVSERVDTRDGFVRALDSFKPDIVLSDFKLPSFDGLSAVKIARQTHPDIPVIMVSGALGDESAVELLKAGAKDYVLKDRLGRLGPAVLHALAAEQGVRSRKLAEEKYRALFNEAKDGIVLLECGTGNILDCNPEYARMCGRTPAELKGHGVWESQPPETREAGRIRFLDVIRNGTGGSNELPLQKPTGEIAQTEFTASTIRVADECYVLGIARDITERKRAEQALLESEARYRRITEGLTDYQYTVRLENGRVVQTTQSQACVTVTGYRADEFAANPHLWIQMVVPEDRESVTARLRQVLSGNDVPPIEHRIMRKDGQLRWVSDTIILFKDAAGALLSYDGVIRDITERVLAAQAIHESEEKYRAIFENVRDIVFLLDRDGNFLSVNSTLEQIAGYKASEWIGRSFAPIIHPDDLPRAQDALRRVLAGEILKNFEVRGVKQSGGHFDVELNLNSIRYAGSSQVLGVARDVTERRHAEESLRASEARLKELFENMSSGVAVYQASADGRDFVITEFNRAAERIENIRREDAAGRNVVEVFPGMAEFGLLEVFRRVWTSGVAEHFPATFYQDQRIAGWRKGYVYRLPQGDVVAIYDDVTREKQDEIELRRINRALGTISSCNETLIHATDESRLLNDMCRIIVEHAGYMLAWVGYAEHDEHKTVRPVASGGYDQGYIERARITWADNERGRGPAGLAIRTQKATVIEDTLTDPAYLPWRDNGVKLGYRSILSLPLASLGQVLGALTIYSPESNGFSEEEIRLLGELADDLAFGIITLRTRKLAEQSAERLLHSVEGTIAAMAAIVELRDPYTAGHQRRVAELCKAIAHEMQLPDEDAHGIYVAAVIHDLGKIRVPAEILSKPAQLSHIEFQLIQTHPQAGYDILKEIDFPWPIAQMVYQHHERLDGTGYPNGLKDAELLPGAKILAVADTVEAMASHRPYRPALGLEAALDEIMHLRGVRYDANVVDACVRLFRERGYRLPA